MRIPPRLLASLSVSFVVFTSSVLAATPPSPGYGPAINPVSNAPGGSSAQATESSSVTDTNNTNNPDMPAGLVQQPETLWRRSTLFGDLDGFRDDMINNGVTFAPVYTGEVMGNVSGGAGGYDGQGRGVIYEHSLNLPVDIDLPKIFAWWPDATIHANALWIAGPGLSPSYVGDISNTSNIQGYNTLRLQELWYQQAFWGRRASLKIGEIAADSEFFTSPTASLFMSGTFGAFTFVGANLPDPYDPNVYPVASPGIRFLIQPVSFFYFMTGLFSGNAESQQTNNHGVDFPIDSQSGVLLFNEIGFLLNQSPNDRGLQGTYKIGSFVHTHDFDSWSSQEDNAVTGAPLRSDGTDYGLYGVVDQQVYHKGTQTVSAFTRVGSAPSDVNAVSWYVDGGFNFTGFVPGRQYDVAGIAVARSIFSNSYSDYQVAANGTNPYTAETVLEATYKVQLAPWWSIQPDFQYIVTPSGETGSPNAVVLGVRTQVAF